MVVEADKALLQLLISEALQRARTRNSYVVVLFRPVTVNGLLVAVTVAVLGASGSKPGSP